MTPQKFINIRGTLVDLSVPKVMGIINITPDSFYAGSRIHEIKGVLLQAEKMLEEGATFLDIGGYSSRPGAKDISAEEELSRVLAPIEAIAKEFPEAYLSIDTFRSTVAKEAVACGAHIVNDISAGLLDDDMLQTVGDLRVPYIGMHMKGSPQTMKEMSDYDDLIREVALYFAERSAAAQAAGILDFIADPGIGFAKTADQSFEVLNHLEYFHDLGFTTLCGVSRKSLIYKSLNITPEAALNGTTVLNTVALMKGVSLLRVHDVEPAMEAINLINKVQI